MKRAGLSDFWSLTKSTRHLPRETRDYVPMILAAIIIAKNPAQYGFEVAGAAPVAYEKVRVPGAVDLRRVAEWTGSTIQDIQFLNPELRRWTTPIRYPDYEVKVPVGTSGQLAEKLSTATPEELVSLNWYAVKRGESLSTIAKKLKVSRTDLAEANNLSTKSRVKTGQELIIPRAPTVLAAQLDRTPPAEEVIAAARPLSGVASPAGDGEGAGTLVATVAVASGAEAAAEASTEPEVAKLVYRVKRGDTLFSIARLFKTSVAALKSWNRLRSNFIRTGDRLTIFSNPDSIPLRLRPRTGSQ
jgi:membrane-bound lytic murein transglycosylase D